MRINQKRMNLVLGRLMQALQAKEYPYNLDGVTAPQIASNMPHNLRLGSREHALFLFCTCYWMRGGIQSDTAFRSLARLHEAHPEIFVPEKAHLFLEDYLAQKFKEYRLGFQAKQIARFWIINFVRLADWYDGDPVKLFTDIHTYEAACDRIENQRAKKSGQEGFYGFRKKMVSMLIYFLTDTGFIKPFHFPPPVDFHVLRIFVAHRMLTLSAREQTGWIYERLADRVRHYLSIYCLKYKVDPLRLCDAMWLLSRALCNQHPGNNSIVGKMEMVNGARIRVRMGRRTAIKPTIITWSEAQTFAYLRSCGSCPVEQSCSLLIPSANYYVSGVIKVRGERTKSPQQILFKPYIEW